MDLVQTDLVSMVIPFRNERENLAPLYTSLAAVTEPLANSFEFIFVDDGSTDGSADIVEQIISRDARVKLVQFRGNFGKTQALSAGFAHAQGAVILTLDADLQDDPREIPRFLDKLSEGYDLVAGYKKTRHDPWHKVWASRVLNAAIRFITGIGLHDVNCGFKCFRREVVSEIVLYGDLHRFIPVIAHWRHFRVAEIVVQHFPRIHGESKYGFRRLHGGLIDLFMVAFLWRYERSPFRLFGGLGMATGFTGLLICFYLSTLWFLGMGPIGNRPLLHLGILLVLTGLQLICLGFLAELHLRSLQDKCPQFGVTRVLFNSDLSKDKCPSDPGRNG